MAEEQGKMVTIDEELMDVEPIPLRKRKVLAKEDPFENGKRVKFESFPKATAKLAVSAVALSVPAEENTLECKKIILNMFYEI